MLINLYMLASLAVFSLAIGPFWRDPSQPSLHLESWLFLALAVALSPITLPGMVWHKFQMVRSANQSDSYYASYSSTL
jgi:cyanate permease